MPRHAALLTAEVPADISDLSADERETSQILTNLLSNDVEFSSAGGIVFLCYQSSPGGIDTVIADNSLAFHRTSSIVS